MKFPTLQDALSEAEREFHSVRLTRASDIQPEAIDWLWDGWLAAGKLHVLAGAPGTGKTTIAIALAATVSCGGRWPDGTQAQPGDVLMWSGEDDPRDTLVPRLLACGADPARVHFINGVLEADGERTFDPAHDALALQAAIRNRPPKLLIVDPVVSAVAGDSHKNAEVRRALQPLVDLAQSARCAVLGISHFSKGTAGRDPVDRVTGSLAFGALARVVLAAAKLPDDEGGGRMLARAKSNIGLDHGGFLYDMEVVDLPAHPGIQTTRVMWGEALEGTARELLAKAETLADPEEHSALSDSKGFLRDLLVDGPVAVKQIKRDSDDAGYAWATLRRAKDALGIMASRDGFGRGGTWKWSLPAIDDHRCSIDAHTKNVSTYEKNEHLCRGGNTQNNITPYHGGHKGNPHRCSKTPIDAHAQSVNTYGHLCSDEDSEVI